MSLVEFYSLCLFYAFKMLSHLKANFWSGISLLGQKQPASHEMINHIINMLY